MNDIPFLECFLFVPSRADLSSLCIPCSTMQVSLDRLLSGRLLPFHTLARQILEKHITNIEWYSKLKSHALT